MVTELARLEQLSLCGVSRATDVTVAAVLDHPERHLRQLGLEGARTPAAQTISSCFGGEETTKKKKLTLFYIYFVADTYTVRI